MALRTIKDGAETMMKRAGLLMALATAASAFTAQDDEYKAQVDKFRLTLADEHAAIGQFLVEQQMFEWSRVEFNEAVQAAPLHEKANKGLGFTVWNAAANRWDPDSAVIPPIGNTKVGAEADKVFGEYQKKLEVVGRKAGGMLVDLGRWCESKGMKDRAAAVFGKALEYDPQNKDARSKLGHVKQKDGGWLSPQEAKLRKELKDGISKAPKGEPVTDGNIIERKLGMTLKKQKDTNFLIQSDFLDQKALEGLMQHAMYTYKMYKTIFKQPAPFRVVNFDALAGKQVMTILKDKAGHDKYVDAVGNTGVMFVETFAREQQAALEDWVIHMAAVACMANTGGNGRPWLCEGTAYYFTKLMHDSASTSFTDSKDYSDHAKWPDAIREWLRTGKDPDIEKLFKGSDLSDLAGGGVVKAWSLVEFLVTEHREKLIEFMQKIDGQAPDGDEKALEAVFGWTLKDLNARWKTWAKAWFEK